jgi:branched-chain amino acid transport system substrate-binding protein
LLGICALLAATSCSPPEPILLGFVGQISGRGADLGIGGRDGALLAIELRNAAGGVGGRSIALVAEDNRADPADAARIVSKFVDLKVAAIIGPMTSAMAMAMVPLVNAAKITTVSPTVTTNALTGRDDYFFRVIAPTAAFAKRSAEFHFYRHGLRRIAAITDLRNKSYTESWLEDYRSAFTAAGGSVVRSLSFTTSETTHFDELASELLASDPDGILILANSVDAAMLCQHIRKRDSQIQITMSEWAATERLIELGGRSVEDAVVGQFLDRDSTRPSWLDFRKRYRDRFGQEPGFAGLTAFDATNVVLDGIARQAKGQTLKESLLAIRSFEGAQGPVVFDEFGDTTRETHLTVVKDGAFVALR